jgi:hypothetical protein
MRCGRRPISNVAGIGLRVPAAPIRLRLTRRRVGARLSCRRLRRPGRIGLLCLRLRGPLRLRRLVSRRRRRPRRLGRLRGLRPTGLSLLSRRGGRRGRGPSLLLDERLAAHGTRSLTGCHERRSALGARPEISRHLGSPSPCGCCSMFRSAGYQVRSAGITGPAPGWQNRPSQAEPSYPWLRLPERPFRNYRRPACNSAE